MLGLCTTQAMACIGIRIWARSPIQHYKATTTNKCEILREYTFICESKCGAGNLVMVVVDHTPEAKGALDWALSHTVQNRDVLILLHVSKQDGKSNGENDQYAYNLLRCMKNMCQLKRPEVHVEMAFREGNDKGAIIVEEAKRLQVLLLVLGHRKQSLLRRMQTIWSRKRIRSRVVDYCIQNANCMTIAVRRKNQKHGGFLITTKRHKNFWLLA